MSAHDQPSGTAPVPVALPFPIEVVPWQAFGHGERFAIKYQVLSEYAGACTSQPCRHLVLGNPQPHDVIVYTETGRVSVRLTGEGYRKSQTLGYWDGVAS